MIPCDVVGQPCAPAEAEVLGLAFDRFNYFLLILMDTNVASSGNDTLMVVDPWGGFIFDTIDVGIPDAQDVAWLANASDNPKSPFNPGSTWIAYGTGATKKLNKLGTATTFDVPGTLPIAGLGAKPYDGGVGQWLIASDLQTVATSGIPIWARKATDGTEGINLEIPAGPTGGGYNDVVLNDFPSQPTVFGAFDGKVGEFDLGGAFLGAQGVTAVYDITTNQDIIPSLALSNITSLAQDQFDTLFLADFASQGKIYSVYLPGVTAGAIGDYAQAITSNPSGDIFLLMDDTGTGGVDAIVEVDDAGNPTGVTFDGPSGNLEGLAFLNGALYTVDNNAMVLYKLDPADGTVLDSNSLPTFICEIGGLTTDGTKLFGVERFADGFNCFDRFYEIDAATAAVTFTTITATGNVPQPFGLDGFAHVTGAPGGAFLLGAKFTGFFSINLSTGAIFDFTPVQTFPPFSITGITQRGTLILFTDESQLVFKAGVPGAPPPENTVAGDYVATFTVTLNPSTPPPVIASFTIERVDELVVTITEPADGAAFTDTTITIKGIVNDPTVQNVTLGIDLGTTVLLGPATFEANLRPSPPRACGTGPTTLTPSHSTVLREPLATGPWHTPRTPTTGSRAPTTSIPEHPTRAPPPVTRSRWVQGQS